MSAAPADPRGPLAAILDRLHKTRRHGNYWTARCPAHEDRNPSLSISEGTDGRVLLNCHAGCTTTSIVQALGISEADLFPPREQTRREVAVYRYEDETGHHLYDVVRFEPKTFRQRRPDGSWGLGDTRRVLYRLPAVVAAIERRKPVYIVEGEKDVHAIERAGGTATCNPMGAGKWRPEYAQQLVGLTQAIIVADNDEPGIAHAKQVADSLEQSAIPHRVVTTAAGKDAADHLAAEHTLEQLIPLITASADSDDTWTPINLASLEDHPPVKPTLGDVGLVYPGKRHIFSGPQESAKTLAAYAISLQVVRSGGTVVVIDFEMGRWDARNRLRELGATNQDLERIKYVDPAEPATEDRIARLVDLEPQLVLIDAAAGAYDIQGLDDNKRGDVERFTSMYVRDFWRAGIATIVLDHVVKNAEARGNYAIGSERKVGGADVHLGFAVISPIKRGESGHYKITTHKDRGGFLRRGRVADLKLNSDPATHALTWEFAPYDDSTNEEGKWRPTHLMEVAFAYIQEHPRCTKSDAYDAMTATRREDKIRAVKFLIEDGYVADEGDAGRSHLVPVKRYDVVPTDSRIPTTFPDVPKSDEEGLFPRSHPLGVERERPLSVDVYDPAVQSLLDDDIPF